MDEKTATFDIKNQRTCQRCLTQFNVNSNHNISCNFHRCTYGGTCWDCCAAVGKGARACAMGKHVTYDESWTKWDDFLSQFMNKSYVGDTGSWIYHPQMGYIMVKWDENDVFRAIPTNMDGYKLGKDLFDLDGIVDICRKYHKKRVSEAVLEVQKRLPFTKTTGYLIAQMVLIDMMKTRKLDGINMIYDLDEANTDKENQVAEHLISGMSSNTLDKLAEIL